jgi:hypothetical protein
MIIFLCRYVPYADVKALVEIVKAIGHRPTRLKLQ